jgi:hypothetical protein
LHHRGWWSRDLQIPQKYRRQQFVDEDSAVLGIIPKLNDVAAAVIRLQQMSLRSSSHFSDVPDGGERHQKENAVT